MLLRVVERTERLSTRVIGADVEVRRAGRDLAIFGGAAMAATLLADRSATDDQLETALTALLADRKTR